MTQSMTERVARALSEEYGIPPDHIWNRIVEKPGETPVVFGQPAWQRFVKDARVAIEAMREPTKAMIEAGWADALAEDAGATWKSMIDAALSEKPLAPCSTVTNETG